MPRAAGGASCAATAWEVGIQTISPTMKRAITIAMAATLPETVRARNGKPMSRIARPSRRAVGMLAVTRVSRSWSKTTSRGLITTSKPQLEAERP